MRLGYEEGSLGLCTVLLLGHMMGESFPMPAFSFVNFDKVVGSR